MLSPTPTSTAQTSLSRPCTAFHGPQRIAHGELTDVAAIARRAYGTGGDALVLVFDDRTGAQIDLDLRHADAPLPTLAGPAPAAAADAAAAAAAAPPIGPRGPGRPKLGVVAREVTLLPRHWDWLAQQSGGASVALRKLVEEARRQSASHDAVRLAREAAYRYMSAMAGDAVGFEEATRALFASQRAAFEAHSASWPHDVRQHALQLAGPALPVAA